MIKDTLQRARADDRFAYDLLRTTQPGLCLDVGAGAGVLTAVMKDRAPRCRVMAFEPFPGNLPHLHNTVEGLDGVSVFEAAVSDESGTAMFYCHATRPEGGTLPGYSSIGYLIRDGMSRVEARTYEVETVRIDDVVSEHVGFMKVDVQGGEPSVLRGAENTIRAYGIDMIYVEFEGDVEILRFLDRRSYVIYDGEYLLYEDDPDWVREWMPDAQPQLLTTGANSYKGHIRRQIPRDHAGYAAWMQAQKGLQTDLLAVHESYVPALERALEAHIADD